MVKMAREQAWKSNILSAVPVIEEKKIAKDDEGERKRIKAMLEMYR